MLAFAGDHSARRVSRAVATSLTLGLLVLGLKTSLGGCSRTPTVLEPVITLIDQIAEPQRSGACEVAHELRPALGCPDVEWIGEHQVQTTAADPFPWETALPPRFLGRGLIVSAITRAAESGKWQDTAPIFAPPGARSVALGLPHPVRWRGGPPVPEQLEVRVRVRPVPPSRQRFVTKPVEVPPRAFLAIGLGITAEAVAAGAGPADFVIEAKTGQKTQQLLRTRVDPEEVREGWVDHRLDLSALAGQQVAFQFSSSVARSGAAPAFSVPVWGAPEILVRREDEGRRNLILISLDTVRADSVLTEAFGARLTPALDALAARGVVFEEAIAPYNSTTASHMSLLTGVYPVLHRVNYPAMRLAPSIPTLAEILSQNGYQTAAITENAMISAGAGFARGFDSYRENRSALDAAGHVDETFRDARRWLERHADERFFLFLHTYEAHAPYKPKGGTLDLFQEISEEERAANRYAPFMREYAAEIRYLDEVLSELIEDLERLALLERSVLIVTSDHGEEFGEHDSMGHSKTVYDEVLRVPLILVAPGLVPAGRRVPEQVSLVDVKPTLLDLLGIPAPAEMHGTSLRALMDGEADGFDAVRFAEGLNDDRPRRRILVARTRDHKWIQLADEGAPSEIYDLRSDPAEKNPRSDPELVARGRELLARYRALEGGPAPTPGPERPLDPDVQRKLEALGYVD